MGDITERSMFILGSGQRNRGGRPRIAAEPTEPVMTRLPLPLYDQLVKQASLEGESVSALVRTMLTVRLNQK